MPTQDTLAASIRKERGRLQKARDRVMQKQKAVDQELDSIVRELAAIEAYEKAKAGKATRAVRPVGRPRRARRGEKRQAILDLVKQHPEGGEILNLMGVKGNKSGEQSVSNALSALTKQQQLGRHEGKYVPAT